MTEASKTRNIEINVNLTNDYHVPCLVNKEKICMPNMILKNDSKLIQQCKKKKVINIIPKCENNSINQKNFCHNIIENTNKKFTNYNKGNSKNKLLGKINMIKIRNGKKLVNIRKIHCQENTNEIIKENSKGPPSRNMYRTFYGRVDKEESKENRNFVSDATFSESVSFL